MEDEDCIMLSVRCKDVQDIWKTVLPVNKEMDNLLCLWPALVYDRYILCPSCVRKNMPNPCRYEDFWLSEHYAKNFISCKNPTNMELMPAELVYPPIDVLEAWTKHYKLAHMNFLRYSRLVMECGAQTMLKILEQHLCDTLHVSMEQWLADNEEVFSERLRGQMKWVRRLLYPASTDPLVQAPAMDRASLDVTVLKTIFSKLLDTFPWPQNDWNNDPDPDDLSQAADILRLGKLRNGPHLAHNPRCELSQQEFENQWQEAEAVIQRLDPHCERDLRRLKLGALSTFP